jgi:hypothetical protein
MHVLLCLKGSSKRASCLSRHTDRVEFVSHDSCFDWSCSLPCLMVLSWWLANVLQIDKIRVLDCVVSLLRGRRLRDWNRYRKRLYLLNFLQHLRSFVLKNLPEVVVHVGVITLGQSLGTDTVHIGIRIILVYLPKLKRILTSCYRFDICDELLHLMCRLIIELLWA